MSAFCKIGFWNAWLFMGVFVFQMAAIFFIDRRAWQRSHVPGETRRNRLETYAGIIGNSAWLIAMLYSVFLPFQLGTAWFYGGLAVFLSGLMLLTIATFNFIGASKSQLITKGVYRLSRHPMYLASFFICLGSGIAAASWMFALLSIMMAFCFFIEARVEEKYCLGKYGDAYKKYMAETPRVMGFFRK